MILLAEKFAIPLDNSIEQFGMPQEFGGAMIAALVLTQRESVLSELLCAINCSAR